MELNIYNKLCFYNDEAELEKECWHKLNSFHWESDPPYRPNTYFKMGVVGDSLVATLKCYEENPRAVFENRDDPIYNDSCLEFFVAPIEEKEEYIDVKTLLEDLSYHGYEDVLIPQKLEEYKSSLPEYIAGTGNTGSNNSVSFEIYKDTVSYCFTIYEKFSLDVIGDYFVNAKDSKTVVVDTIDMNVFTFESGTSAIHFTCNKYEYLVQAQVSLSEMINIAQTIIKMEE